MRRYGVVLLTAALVVSCSKVPDGILSEKEMKAVLIDMQLAEAMISTDYKKYSDDAEKEMLYQSVFRKHNIEQAVYDSSLVWYGRNLDVYMQVYDLVLAELNERQKALGDVQASAAPVSKQEKPSSFATAFATVDLPAPEGPSIAMIIYANPFKQSRNVGKLMETQSKSMMSTGVSEQSPTNDQVMARRWSLRESNTRPSGTSRPGWPSM